MEQFIRYLFEYRENRRIRNTGFVKVRRDDGKTVVHIYGQGLRLAPEQTLDLFVYELEEDVPVGQYQGTIDRINPSIHYVLTYSPEDVGRDAYGEICGILLRAENGRTFAASWNDMPIRAEEFQIRTVSEREIAPTFTEAIVKEVCEEKRRAEQVCEEEEPCMDQEPCEEEKLCEEPAESCEEEEPCAEPESCGEEEPRLQIRKIDRQEIASLPRCEWRLANNSFLLHGYYNYHYLVFVEEGGELWIGVPGVYHKQEEKAAYSFGFSRFVKEDKTDDETFGYWCRKVRRRIRG